MKPSLPSISGRAATYLCASCRKEAVAVLSIRRGTSLRGALFSTATQASRQRDVCRDPAVVAQRRIFAGRALSTTASSSPSIDPNTAAQPSSSSNNIPTYYALFPETLPHGPPPKGKFHIDLRALRREFLRLQAASHPDFHHHAAQSSSEQASKSDARLRAEATSALLNTAYKTLSSPLLRAQYLLREQHGIDLEGDESTVGHHHHGGLVDPELLMTVLEAREALDEAQTEGEVEEIRRVNEERIKESEARLGEAFERGDVEGAREEAVRLRYWVSIREGVDQWEHSGRRRGH